MADELEPIAPLPELDTPAIEETAEVEIDTEAEEQELPVDTDPGDEPEGGEGEDGGEPEPIEFVTIERNGKQFQVPKELEGEFMMQADYTRKRQADAERAKELDEREAAITKQAEATEAELDARATLRTLNAEIDRFKDYDWATYQQHRRQDPMGADEAWQYKAHLQNQKAELEGTISKALIERTEKAQQDLAKRVQETAEAALKIIPGLTAENRGPAIDKLVAFAASEGVPEQTLKDLWSPTFLKILHQAQIGKMALSKQAAPKPAPKPAPAPLQTVRAATSPQATRSLSDIAKSDDMEAYAAARAKGRTR
jgi:hypothetical protein